MQCGRDTVYSCHCDMRLARPSRIAVRSASPVDQTSRIFPSYGIGCVEPIAVSRCGLHSDSETASGRTDSFLGMAGWPTWPSCYRHAPCAELCDLRQLHRLVLRLDSSTRKVRIFRYTAPALSSNTHMRAQDAHARACARTHANAHARARHTRAHTHAHTHTHTPHTVFKTRQEAQSTFWRLQQVTRDPVAHAALRVAEHAARVRVRGREVQAGQHALRAAGSHELPHEVAPAHLRQKGNGHEAG